MATAERELLIEVMEFAPGELEIVESATPGGPMILRGIFQRSDVKNSNNRIYPRSLWERVLGDLDVKKRIEERRMFGLLDHPADGKTHLQNVSHLVKRAELQPDGTVVGEAEILPTPSGKILQTLIENGCQVAISSRGTGSVSRQTNTVQDDFKLQSWDFVADPSTSGAYPKPIRNAIRYESEDQLSTIVEEARRFVNTIPATMEVEPSVRVSLLSGLIGHEIQLERLLESAPADQRSRVAQVLEETRQAKRRAEDTIRGHEVVGARDDAPDSGGSNTMAGTASTMTPEEAARVGVMEHQNEQLSEAVGSLGEENEGLAQRLEASYRVIDELTRRYHGLLGEAQQVAEYVETADSVVDALCEEIDKMRAESLSESSQASEGNKRERGSVSLIESLLRRNFAANAFIEELGARCLATEELAEGMLQRIRESLLEAAIEEKVSGIQTESAQEAVRAFLMEAETVDEVESRYGTLVSLTEAAEEPQEPQQPAQQQPQQPSQVPTVYAPYQQAAYHNVREPLPTPSGRAQMAAAPQALQESAASIEAGSPRMARSLALAARVDGILRAHKQ